MRQLVLDLAQPQPPSLATFRVGRNGEALAMLRRLMQGDGAGQSCYLWGAPGAGKSYLLRAAVASLQEAGVGAMYVDLRTRRAAGDAGARADAVPEADDKAGARANADACRRADSDADIDADGDAEGIAVECAGARFLALDHVDESDARGQGLAFSLFNQMRERGGAIAAAGRVPVARLAVRDDLRTRLGWGPSFEIVALDDEEKAAAMAEAAAARGIVLPVEVSGYLLRHGPRDLDSLLAALAGIDRLSLSQRRPVSVLLAREWLSGRHRQAPAGARVW